MRLYMRLCVLCLWMVSHIFLRRVQRMLQTVRMTLAKKRSMPRRKMSCMTKLNSMALLV